MMSTAQKKGTSYGSSWPRLRLENEPDHRVFGSAGALGFGYQWSVTCYHPWFRDVR